MQQRSNDAEQDPLFRQVDRAVELRHISTRRFDDLVEDDAREGQVDKHEGNEVVTRCCESTKLFGESLADPLLE